MIPFDELVAALERLKQRKAAGAPVAQAAQVSSGKQGQVTKPIVRETLAADDLLDEA